MWNSVEKAGEGGILGVLNKTLCTLQENRPTTFPNFLTEQTIFAASDYSGQHKGAKYEAYSFVFTSPKSWSRWERHRLEVRSRFLLTRNMSYKTLDDKKRWEMLPYFMSAVAMLPGITLTILVHKSISSLFAVDGKLDMSRPGLEKVADWKISSVEKLLRITHFMGLLFVGLSGHLQNLIWITDEDDIVANEERLGITTGIGAEVCSALTNHRLGHFRLGTTANQATRNQLEDLAAIPDFCSGALVSVLDDMEKRDSMTSSSILLPVSPSIPRKSKAILQWFTGDFPMKQVAIAIDPTSTDGLLDVRRLVFDKISAF